MIVAVRMLDVKRWVVGAAAGRTMIRSFARFGSPVNHHFQYGLAFDARSGHVVGPTTGVTRNRVSSFVRRGDRYFAANDTGSRLPRSLQYPICDGCAGLHEIRCPSSASRKDRVMIEEFL